MSVFDLYCFRCVCCDVVHESCSIASFTRLLVLHYVPVTSVMTWPSVECYCSTEIVPRAGFSVGCSFVSEYSISAANLTLCLSFPQCVYVSHSQRHRPWGTRVFITNVKGTFLGMSESEEASKRR